MRWRYLDVNNPHEAKRQKEVLQRIDRWWRDFEKRAPKIDDLIHGGKEWDLPEWMSKTLQAIDEDIMWEFGPAVSGNGHRLVITPEGNKHLRPLVATVLERAPKLPGWEFHSHRVPEDAEMASHTVEARSGGSLEGVVVQVRGGRLGRIDLRFLGPETSGPEDEQAGNDAFVATETLVGEELLDKYIGAIEADAAPPSDGPKPIPLSRLHATVKSVVGSRRDQLPDRPCLEWVGSEETEWSTLTLEPEEADDYTGLDDLYVAVTCHPEMWEAALCDNLFYSERFSRFGESFCYIKMDGAGGLEGSTWADRSEIEDALNEALVPGKVGITLGGGTGRRYSYIELALRDLDRGIERVRKLLSEGGLTERSWILFHDVELSGEWIGIYPHSPAPPGFDP